MTNPGFLSKRLMLAINQSPSTRITCCPNRLPPPKVWIRTITSSSKRQRNEKPLVSFGKENDNVLAPYIKKTNHTSALSIRRLAEAPQTAASDEYEIDQFVDRSRPTHHEASDRHRSPSDVSDAMEEAPARFSMSRRPRKEPDTSQGFRRRDQNSLSFGADTNANEYRTRRTRSSNKETDPNSSAGSGRQLVRKVTEDAEKWTIQKNALKEKFKEGWQPRKKLSPDAQEGIRGLHEQDPITYSTDVLAKQFKQSPEAIRRILKSKWQSQQSPEKLQERRERWAKRHDRIWDAKAEIGQRPSRRKNKEVEDPDKFEQDLERRRILGEI